MSPKAAALRGQVFPPRCGLGAAVESGQPVTHLLHITQCALPTVATDFWPYNFSIWWTGQRLAHHPLLPSKKNVKPTVPLLEKDVKKVLSQNVNKITREQFNIHLLTSCYCLWQLSANVQVLMHLQNHYFVHTFQKRMFIMFLKFIYYDFNCVSNERG